MFSTPDQAAAASILGLMVGLASYAVMQWRDARTTEAESYQEQVAEMSKARAAARTQKLDSRPSGAESVPTDNSADYWDRDDLITLLFEEREIQAGVDRPWAPRLIVARTTRMAAEQVH